MTTEARAARRPVAFAVFSIVAGAIGWFAAFELLTEYIKTLQNPDYIPNCSVSVLVTCGPNMDSWQGSLFGFSNTIIGVAAFVAPIAVGVALLAGASFSRWFWWIYQLGLLGGFVFIGWLFSQSVFVLHTLCPWCMVVWAVMIPLWWVSLAVPHSSGLVPLTASGRRVFAFLASWSWVLILLCYVIIAFIAQLQLDWFAEFSRA
ncbi:vitamin K epoxide reductase family protein [Leucobacter allii]|uniref:Vitamin K epoxide reductase family protein n=1 Tax=Leucobacter allii TaxID=2932247 RepID=A0ABY4FQ39_9MICO|nr:vitamin K epoxide reductase family protein [Leucobacter allii]UOQ58400.1 vitamin K epoxide reductase family protein [Leucobacter allii]UOR02980.1 vitamin K epoxide reductase family protein [Leucobacter allii]